jgi:transposase
MMSVLEQAEKCLKSKSKFLNKTKRMSLHVINALMAATALSASGGDASHAAAVLDVATSTVYRRIDALHKDVIDDIGNHRKKPGPKQSMTYFEQKELVSFVLSTRPCDVGLDTLYWDAELLVFIIHFFFNKIVSASTVKRIMRRGGLSYKRAEFRNIRRDEKYIAEWIADVAPQCLAEDYINDRHPVFLDECGVNSISNRFEGWSKKGERAVAPQGKCFGVNVIGCIGVFGESHFLTTSGTIDSEFVIAFLNSLHEAYPTILFSVYLDGAKIHWSGKLIEYLKENTWVHFRKLPAYAPELNPIELLWADLKNNWMKRSERLTLDTFRSCIDTALCKISEGIRRYERYWHANEIQYIAKSFEIFNNRTRS